MIAAVPIGLTEAEYLALEAVSPNKHEFAGGVVTAMAGAMPVAELVGTLSVAADLSAGMPDGHALRGAVVAAAFAEELAVDVEVARHAYYLPPFAMSGCSAEAHTAASVIAQPEKVGADGSLGRPERRPR